MQIEPVPTNFRKVASSSFLHIPPFQRPYSWTDENIEEFWYDLISAKGGEYFMGSFVFYDHSTDPAGVYITDGQQRITTLTITLCVIRDTSRKAELNDVATGIQNLIERANVDNKKRFILKYGASNKYLAKAILSENGSGTHPQTDEERAQKRAYDLLQEKLQGYLITNLGPAWLSHSKLEGELISIRNTILGMTFITLTLQNEDDAYLVFETLNSRGKDLEVSDLLKNLFSKMLKSKNKDVAVVIDAWDAIRGRFAGLSSRTTFDSFLLHYWLSVESFVSKKKLFQDMKRKIVRSKARERLRHIEVASQRYVAIASPADYAWAKEEYSVKLALDAINRFGVQQSRPLLLSILAAYVDRKVASLKQVKRAVRYIEAAFTFKFNAITQSRGGGGITAMYSSLARDCTKTNTEQEFADFSGSMLLRFRERNIDRDEFVVAFKKLKYHNEFTKDRALTRYILRELHEKLNGAASSDYDTFSIEHLHSQSGGLKPAEYGNIGNLWFLPEKLNNKLKNKSFEDKKPILLEGKQGDGIFDHWSDAAADQISGRAQMLAEISFDKVWKL